MRRYTLFCFLAALIALAAGWRPEPAVAACVQAADGRCEAQGVACNPPADGRCTTMAASSLSSLAHACRCVSPRQYGPHAAGPGQKSCRQRCNTRDLTCEASARSFNQRNACTSRNATCNSHC